MHWSRTTPFTAGSVAVILVGWTAVVLLSPESTRLWTSLVLAASIGLTVWQLLSLNRQARKAGAPAVVKTGPLAPRKSQASSPRRDHSHKDRSFKDRGYVVPFMLPPSGLLVGRDEKLDEIQAYLTAESGVGLRMAVIYGPAGIGKTALAIKAAHLVAGDFTDGVLFASLGGPRVDSETAAAITESVLGAFVGALQGPHEPGPVGYDARLYRFRELTQSRSRLLVVLDDVPDADAVAPLLPASGSGAVLLTSRNALDIPDALPVPLAPLATAPATDLLREIVGERINHEEDATRAILKRAAGSPLALQLAAASLASRPDDTLISAVQKMLLLPSPATPDDGAFSRTLDLSFALLTEQERKALLLLGLLDTQTFAPWKLAALTEDIDERTAWRLCDRLAQARLLEHVIDPTGVVAYRMLEHVRDYARVRLSHQQPRWGPALQRLRDEQGVRGDNDLREMLRERVYTALEQGRLSKALNHARGAVAQARDNVVRARERFDANATAGSVQSAGGRPISFAPELLAEAREVEGLALAALAEVLAELGGVEDALEIADSALATKSAHAKPRVLRIAGKILRRQRRLGEAQTRLLEALADARNIPDGPEQARILRELAIVHAYQGRTGEGLQAVEEALNLNLHPKSAIRHRSTLLWAKAIVLLNAAEREVVRSAGASPTAWLQEADRALMEAGKIADSYKQRLWRAWIGCLHAQVTRRLGRFEFGRALASRAMEDFAQMPHRYGGAWCRLEIGRSYLEQGLPREALPRLEEALRTFATCGDRWIEEETAVLLAAAQRQVEALDDPLDPRTAVRIDRIRRRQRQREADDRPRTLVGFWTSSHGE